jgi:hypothetical protein
MAKKHRCLEHWADRSTSSVGVFAAVAGLTSLLLVSGCGKANAPIAEQPARSTTVLVTTWLVQGQPPQTTQTNFGSADKCETARLAVAKSGDDARAQIKALNQQAVQEVREAQEKSRADAEARFGQGVIVGPSPADLEKLKGEPLPVVSAACLNQ